MRQIKTLIFMQLKDKIDVSWIYSNKSRIHTVVLAIVKFLVITLIYSLILFGASKLGLVYYFDMPQIMTFVMTLALVLSFISCAYGLMKTLYFAEDNKVLITMPIRNNKIFISKLLVFYFYEIKRSFSFTIPLILACAINLSLKNCLHWTSYLWMILPIVLLIALPVLLGSLFSIPLMYLYRFMNKYSVVKGFLALFIIIGFIAGSIYLINFIPSSIDLIVQWPEIRSAIMNFLNDFEKRNIIITNITRSIIGQKQSNGIFYVDGWTLLKTLVLLVSVVILYFLNYFISRPIFFKMMSKNFEFNKNATIEGINKKHSPFISFNIKEFKVSFRSMEISINYLAIYIIIPILILLLDRIFDAIDKNSLGYRLSYAFNILIILLPLLASNSLIATLYSKEGRAGYIKKTKPVKPIVPLFAKLTFNLVLSIPCVIVSVIIFGKYADLGVGNTMIMVFAILFLHYGHIFYCATLDIMNPQNELYATSGEDVNNENENKASVVAFVLTLIYSLFAFKLFSEVGVYNGMATACLKMFFISLGIALYLIISFVLKVKAFYGEK